MPQFVLKRVEDYWGKDLPVNIGQDNFDEIEYIFFRDANVRSKPSRGTSMIIGPNPAQRIGPQLYDFPAIKDGRCIKEEIQLKGVEGMQSFALNLRREKFQDVRVRKAFNYAFDFEWSNANLFYGQYTRSRSFFNNSDMEAKGLPSPEELALLEPLKDQLPAEVFTTEYRQSGEQQFDGAAQEFARSFETSGGSGMECYAGRQQIGSQKCQGRETGSRVPAGFSAL